MILPWAVLEYLGREKQKQEWIREPISENSQEELWFGVKKRLKKKKVKVKAAQLCLTLCDPMDYTGPWNSPGQNTGMVSLSLLQGIFPNQGSNPGLPHCRQILYQLSPQGSPQ